MDPSNNLGAQLLIKQIHGDITPEERVLLDKCIEEFPALKVKLEELYNPDNLWDRFWYQHEVDTDEAWTNFKKEHSIKQPPDADIK